MIRLHIPAIPHTITTDEYSHCAFTGKVKRFGPMMYAQGFFVYHYGVEGSDSGAFDINLFSRKEWDYTRLLSICKLKNISKEQGQELLNDPSQFSDLLANTNSLLYTEFNRRLLIELNKNYRRGDIICLPFGHAHDAGIPPDALVVESGIGYTEQKRRFRIFESYAWMHMAIGKENRQQENYWFVVPNYYNLKDWTLNESPKKIVGFLGRISHCKGCHIIKDIASRMPDVKFILCGQGNASEFLGENIFYMLPISGTERSKYLGNLACLLTPSTFVEPFCGVSVEAQLCGTPVIGSESGGLTETIEHGKTGLLCHTIADYILGIRMALEGKFDRVYIRKRAERYGTDTVGKQYAYAFKCIRDVLDKGYYSDKSNMQ